MSKLLDLMRKLGSDAALAAEYEKNQDMVLRRAGLTEEERKAIAAKDYEAIKRLTGLTDGQFATNHVVRVRRIAAAPGALARSGRSSSHCCCRWPSPARRRVPPTRSRARSKRSSSSRSPRPGASRTRRSARWRRGWAS
jgi:hypothetical protein